MDKQAQSENAENKTKDPNDLTFFEALGILKGKADAFEVPLEEAERALGRLRSQLTKMLDHSDSMDEQLRLNAQGRRRVKSTKSLLLDFAKGGREPAYMGDLIEELKSRGIDLDAFEAEFQDIVEKYSSMPDSVLMGAATCAG